MNKTKLNGNYRMSLSANNLWSGILGNWILPAGDYLFGQQMMKRLRYLEEAQWWDRERILNERDQQLRSLIGIAYREVPFYRDLMDEAGVKPDDVRSIKDLSKLPVTTKDLIRANFPHRTVRSTGQKTYESHTSGSTGKNFCVIEDHQTAGRFRAAFLLALEWAGWKMGEPHLQTGITSTRNLERKIKDAIMRCYYVSAYDLTNENLDRGLNWVEQHNLKHVWGFPGSLYVLALRAIEKGLSFQLRSIVTWGDTLYPHYRQTIEKVFGTRVHDTYGCSEGIQISAQCGTGTDYHIHSLDTIVEFLDDNYEQISPGNPGNLIITRLDPGPMPLIRYRIGDIGVSGNSRMCECGRGFEMMESVQGRDTDIVVTPDGNRLIVQFFVGVLEHFPEIDSFQVIQKEIDSMLIRVVPSKDFTKELENKIVSLLRDKGARLKIDIEPVKDIPVSPSGKRRFIISDVLKLNTSSHVV
jgi:phenylacetate-coenzyme A ligase PaaK-like adenylate-forming protein